MLYSRSKTLHQQQHRPNPGDRFALRIVGALLLFVALAVAFGINVASAQTVPATAHANWANSTQSECVAEPPQGSDECVRLDLTGQYALTGIQVFISTAPIADDSTMQPTATLPPGATTYDYTGNVPNGSTLYVRLKAVNAFGASRRFSNQATKLVQIEARPEAPTDLTIELRITLPALP